ncbi:hypothetical protein BDV38DRAFT_281525 [Aspergillus pseudotamarii]|uniref:WAP domain-containing protein n=1 Tax=Aspergillus pseudotamarii TaxID=132259 RepID=A0A5N6SWC0_ASPPS|nr:uncharacterized protein BDV38DRAFT_281525 [Aspergillus pseudotamarii]KAE8138965.1 hypothetical protein BDV38DRAFT_281525 [Aspergillus pseudotamarii]
MKSIQPKLLFLILWTYSLATHYEKSVYTTEVSPDADITEKRIDYNEPGRPPENTLPANAGQWLNNAQHGSHIGQTSDFENAGQFTLSKWPRGKHCLGGFDWGIGPACPALTPAMTFYTRDPQMCVPFEITEVPCDVHADQNNCLWKNGDQCCNKVDCSAH